MIPAAISPLAAISNMKNGIVVQINKIKDRISSKMKEVKSNMFKAKNLKTALKFSPVFGLATAAIAILRKPLEFILMLIGGIIISIIFALYKITVYPPLNWIIFLIWFFITKVVFLIVYTIIIGVVIVFICFFLMIIALINHFGGGLLNNLVLCQNSPDAWYKIPNYHMGNKFERSLFCKSTCATGHAPDELTGEFCDRIGRGQPSYCPQAEIMRIISNHSRSDLRYKYGDYDPTTNIWFNVMTPADKETAYKQYFMKRQKFFTKCNDSMGTYNNMTLNLCSSLDMMKKQKLNNLSDKDMAKLEKVCHQGYCNSKNRYAFCGKFGKMDEDSKSLSELIKQIAFLIILALIFMFILYFTYQFASSI
jgi:hypothetical protein